LNDVLRELIYKPQVRMALATAARQRALRYAPATMGEAYDTAYQTLLSAARVPVRVYPELAGMEMRL
jgi:hypothetical protein